MARDPLRMLRVARRLAVEQARHVLAACLAAEAGAADRVRALDEAAERDRAATQSVAEAHRFADMFALRLAATAVDRRTAAADLAAARAASAEARAQLVAARTAAEMVATLAAERAESVEADGRRREQHALDDIARNRFDLTVR